MTFANRPELWDDILQRVEKVYPQAVIAGGCVRDYQLGWQAKDVDVFVKSDATSAPLLEVSDFVSEGNALRKADPKRTNITTAAGAVITVAESITYDAETMGGQLGWVEDLTYQGIPVQIIGVKTDPWAGSEVVKRFDIGLCMAWYSRSDGLNVAPAFIDDSADRTITIIAKNARKMEQSEARANKLRDAHQGWQVRKK